MTAREGPSFGGNLTIISHGPWQPWVDRLLDRFSRRPQPAQRWPVLQVEVTSRCIMRCSFCPNKSLGAAWEHGDLPWEVFRDAIGSHLSRFELIYLQGWGEPLLHRDLWQMVRLAKEAGCQVGFTSCGGLLTEEHIEQIIAERVDLLSISFAGATAAVHASLRVGSDFERLLGNVRRLTERRAGDGRKKEEGKRNMAEGDPCGRPYDDRPRPHLELHYLMMRPNMGDLPAFVSLAASLGADEVVATNLTYAFTPDLDALHVFGPSPDPSDEALIAEAGEEAARLRLKFRAYPLATSEAVVECDARPTETAFINCRGEVTPCVYLGLPVKGAAPRYCDGVDRPLPGLSFGNVREGLLIVWDGPARKKFGAAFASRRAAGYSSLLVSATGGDAGALPAPPEPCRHCYKLLGV